MGRIECFNVCTYPIRAMWVSEPYQVLGVNKVEFTYETGKESVGLQRLLD